MSKAARVSTARIGCSGWDYADWRGSFYPARLPEPEWFGHYASVFGTVELNSTFYRLPDERTVDRWRDQAPPGFTYSVKLSRYGSHLKHLRDPELWLARFFDRIGPLGGALGPVLAQLPPRWRADPGRLDAFLAAVPAGIRLAVEVRDPSWLCRSVYDVLAAHGAALCLHDLLPGHPRIVTADWVYMRFHGPDRSDPYGGRYSAQSLSGAARRIRGHLAAGRDVYAYFNNDRGGAAPRDAARLVRFVGSAGRA